MRSPVLDSRCSQKLDVDVADWETTHVDSKQWLAKNFHPAATVAPKAWSEFMMPAKWRSPSPEGGFESCIAWQYLLEWYRRLKSDGVQLNDHYWNRLVFSQTILCDKLCKYYYVLQKSTYGCLVWELEFHHDRDPWMKLSSAVVIDQR